MSSSKHPPTSFVMIVPVKHPAIGKSRLAVSGPAQRPVLAAAFARDTIAAAGRAPSVVAVLAVTDDFRFAAELEADGCRVIPDGVTDDLNETLAQAAAEAARRWPDAMPAALCSDLPCLTGHDLESALREVRGPSFVRDAVGSGTTMYAASYADFRPAFGRDSAARHLLLGASEVGSTARTLRHDVDDADDLAAAAALGLGPHSRAAWQASGQHDGGPPPVARHRG